ncbi:hypothetical protein O181_029789 [Austropuccinia psidii MF-1]|uniref:Uncharacterized protein n=1 Tax=Austropuccinia psidii MF-1 TaxID=1389203 RepID=A0A9Q3H4X4_9BASI|nr:hypothetical protein [Austropuccinia psidii MF-1]
MDENVANRCDHLSGWKLACEKTARNQAQLSRVWKAPSLLRNLPAILTEANQNVHRNEARTMIGRYLKFDSTVSLQLARFK